MELQNEGWPLGLTPINLRIQILEALQSVVNTAEDLNGALFSSSSSNYSSSTDFDSSEPQSIVSFTEHSSSTLGSLIGFHGRQQQSQIIEYSQGHTIDLEVQPPSSIFTHHSCIINGSSTSTRGIRQGRRFSSFMRCAHFKGNDASTCPIGHLLEEREFISGEKVYLNIIYEEEGFVSESAPLFKDNIETYPSLDMLLELPATAGCLPSLWDRITNTTLVNLRRIRRCRVNRGRHKR